MDLFEMFRLNPTVSECRALKRAGTNQERLAALCRTFFAMGRISS